jgi:Calx-beta domain-containing protein/VCBS repeat protein
MATPHVTGAAALLNAQSPGRDWREVKNLLLAGGDARPSLGETITGRRLSARGSVRCNGAVLTSRIRPLGRPLLVGVGGAVELAVLNIDCARPAGGVVVTVVQTGETVALADDGLTPDQVAGDGVYSAVWHPVSPGTFTLSFPDGSVVTAEVDPYLKPGFPVMAFDGQGTYHGGQGIHTLVGNIDRDPDLEIVVTGLATGPLYAWKADGTAVPGWPLADDVFGAGYPALGELEHDQPGLEVVSGHFDSFGPNLAARSGSGSALPGWPQRVNFVATPATLSDVDGDGRDEIFVEAEDGRLHAYRADGTTLSGWPSAVASGSGQDRHTPAIADLDGDGIPEVVTVSGSTSLGISLLANHRDGTPVSGFPVMLFRGKTDTFPVIGDVDGDGAPEIAVVGSLGGPFAVLIVSGNGTLKRTLTIVGDFPISSAPALADLDGDGTPEIILQTDQALNVWKGDGSVLPGWPYPFEDPFPELGNGSAVVGDVDGDGEPDLVALNTQGGFPNLGHLFVFNRNGTLHPSFPRPIAGLGGGAVPAIADIDGDGRNEIIVTSDFWDGRAGYHNKVWAYDLGGPPHGPVLWGQFMGGPSHDGHYRRQTGAASVSVVRAGDGIGRVSSEPAGVDCGTDCSEAFPVNTRVTLTAAPEGGSFFLGWLGPCQGAFNPCVVTADAAKSVTAIFARSLVPSLSIDSVSVAEGNTGTVNAVFTVSLSSPSLLPVSVSDATSNRTATAGSDYTPASGTLTFSPGSTRRTITVTVKGDVLDEDDETLAVELSAPSNATLATPVGTATILDDDQLPTLSVADATVTDGNAGTVAASFLVALSAPSGRTVTVSYQTADVPGGATAGIDYRATSAVLTFPPGSQVQFANVPVISDGLGEGNETFLLQLGSPVNATLVRSQAIGTIFDRRSGPGDFNSDLNADVLWWHQPTGRVAAWLMQGTTRREERLSGAIGDTEWRVVGTGDFNADGKADVLWRRQGNGLLGAWTMDGTMPVSFLPLDPPQVTDSSWRVVGTGDFDGGGTTDILWWNRLSGQVVVWSMDGLRRTSSGLVDTIADTTWRPVVVADLNGDGRADIVWRREASTPDTGQLAVWFMNGATRTGAQFLAPSQVNDLGWQIVAAADYDGDGQTDLLWRRTLDGTLLVWLMNGSTRATTRLLNPSPVNDPAWLVVGPK